MNINAVWTEEIPRQMPQESQERINGLLELMDFFVDHDIKNYMDEDSVYEDPDFCEWIYSRDTAGMNELKRELMTRMKRCPHIVRNQYQEWMENIGRSAQNEVVGIDFREEIDFFAVTVNKVYEVSRKYLQMEKRNDFIQSIGFCYPDIYFDSTVSKSFHTLNRKFEDIRGEIVKHLTALNGYKDKFLKLSGENKGYREIADEFQCDSGIECSPQAGRDHVAGLRRSIYNEVSKEEESITCEMHTKFKKYNIDRQKQDRIYFAPSKQGIQKGKVVVVHIGTHQK